MIGNEPASVGVPERVPSVARLKPPGRTPDVRLNVYGPVPPEAVKDSSNRVPTVPEVTAGAVIRIDTDWGSSEPVPSR